MCNNESEEREPPEGARDCGSTGSNFFPARRSQGGSSTLSISASHTFKVLLILILAWLILKAFLANVTFSFHLELTSLQKYSKLPPKIQYRPKISLAMEEVVELPD